MTFFQGIKLVIDGIWTMLCLNLTFDNITFTIWQFFAFFIILGLMTKMIFGGSTND